MPRAAQLLPWLLALPPTPLLTLLSALLAEAVVEPLMVEELT
jgi:hypothetical protein